MRMLRLVCSSILPLCLGMTLLGAARPPKQNDNRDNRPQGQAKPQEAPKPQAQPQSRPQEQPKPQEQPRQQASQPKPQAQPRPQEQPKQQAQPRPQAQPQQNARQQEQPRPQASQPKPQEQPRQQAQPRPQAQPQQNARQQEQPARPQENRPAQPSENRAPAGNRGQAPAQQAGRQPQGGANPQVARQGHTAPTTQDRQRAQSFQSARRVPQTDERNIFQQRRATGNWASDHRDWQARGGYNGYRIPDARFGLYFGQNHFFHIYGLPLVYVGGYPEFQYEGYWFEILDPIPPDWGPDFFQTDNVWINWDPDYGGYYLYDANFPGEAVAVDIISG